ncbi:MAG: C39 family peptidase [bacterium]|nr:C39 family peptidase [bacterium]
MTSLPIEIRTQPTDSTCGPTCLWAVYKYWKQPCHWPQLLEQVEQLPGGGTLAVHLAIDALRRGLQATISTYNLQLFDPTWFRHQAEPYFPEYLSTKLVEQKSRKSQDPQADQIRLAASTEAYLEFLKLGGRLQMQPLEESLITNALHRGVPILCGLSATYLYQESRERNLEFRAPGPHSPTAKPDDTGGYPVGHFVVVYGFDPSSGDVEVADPMHENPFSDSHRYRAPFSQLATALLLGIVTYDANLLFIAKGD